MKATAGGQAPEFSSINQHGQQSRLADFRGEKSGMIRISARTAFLCLRKPLPPGTCIERACRRLVGRQ